MPSIPRVPNPTSELSDTFDLIKRYVLQETVDPLRNVGKVLGYGLGGALLLATGLVLLDVAFLRLLQTETGTTFAGNLSWVPYVLTTVLAIILLGLAVLVALRGSSQPRRDGAKV